MSSDFHTVPAANSRNNKKHGADGVFKPDDRPFHKIIGAPYIDPMTALPEQEHENHFDDIDLVQFRWPAPMEYEDSGDMICMRWKIDTGAALLSASQNISFVRYFAMVTGESKNDSPSVRVKPLDIYNRSGQCEGLNR